MCHGLHPYPGQETHCWVQTAESAELEGKFETAEMKFLCSVADLTNFDRVRNVDIREKLQKQVGM